MGSWARSSVDRAPVFGTGCRGFESRRAHQCQHRHLRMGSPSHRTTPSTTVWSYPIAQFIQRNKRAEAHIENPLPI